jgi:hypothetical protein
MRYLGYRLGRWLVNRTLWKKPKWVVPILEDLMNFARIKLTVKEYDRMEDAYRIFRNMPPAERTYRNEKD